jgi:FdhD protein
VCGKGALEEVAVLSPPVSAEPTIARSLAAGLPSHLDQPGFRRTGGLHATGLFDADGELLYTREDVGRHNAMDKVVGRALMDGLLPLSGRVLCVSGRLAIELAADRGLTLCGFARRGTVNVYTHPQRIAD